MPCTYCPYKLLPNAYSIYVWQYTHICTYMWREDSPPQFLPTTCPLPPGNACVWQLQLYFRMEGCGGGGRRYARRTIAQVVANFLPSHVNCQSIHEMRMIWLICVLRMLANPSSPLPERRIEKPKTLWLIQMMFGLSCLAPSLSLSLCPFLSPHRTLLSSAEFRVLLTHVINYTPRVAVQAIKFTHLIRRAPLNVTHSLACGDRSTGRLLNKPNAQCVYLFQNK